MLPTVESFSDDDASPSAEVPKLAPESADAEPLEEAAYHPHRRMLGGRALWLKVKKGGRTYRLSRTPWKLAPSLTRLHA
eukprot:6211118-Pleurochrysis_carterae.AAC.1